MAPDVQPETLLALDDLQVAYGALVALKGVSLHVRTGEVVALLGANGAGKSTTLRAISRTVPLAGGSIRFRTQELGRLPPHQVVAAGIAQVPEGRRIFPELTTIENLDLGAYCRLPRPEYRARLDLVFGYFPILAERQHQRGGTLSGGEQQMLAVGRALMSRPELLLLDEPSLGLAPKIVDTIFAIIREINRREQVTILLVEQNANEALQHADRAYILETGKVQMSGPASELLADPRVKAAYLGG